MSLKVIKQARRKKSKKFSYHFRNNSSTFRHFFLAFTQTFLATENFSRNSNFPSLIFSRFLLNCKTISIVTRNFSFLYFHADLLLDQFYCFFMRKKHTKSDKNKVNRNLSRSFCFCCYESVIPYCFSFQWNEFPFIFINFHPLSSL